jgi:hypothetical protein
MPIQKIVFGGIESELVERCEVEGRRGGKWLRVI